jgi:hypothetical protein
MEHTSEQSAPIIIRSGSDGKKTHELLNSEEYRRRIHGIWNKVTLLENVGVIKDDCDKFNYAFRFAEIELQKVYIELVSLRARLNGIEA